MSVRFTSYYWALGCLFPHAIDECLFAGCSHVWLHGHDLHWASGLCAFPTAAQTRPSGGYPPCGNEHGHLEEAKGHFIFLPRSRGRRDSAILVRRGMGALHHTPAEGVVCMALLHVGDEPGRKWKPWLRTATPTYDLCISYSSLAFPLVSPFQIKNTFDQSSCWSMNLRASLGTRSFHPCCWEKWNKKNSSILRNKSREKNYFLICMILYSGVGTKGIQLRSY